MATIGKITTASSGSAAIDYAYGRNKMPAATKDWLKQQGVDPATVEQLQNRAVVMSGLNVDPEYAKTQMKATRMAYSTRGKQTTRVIQSFPTIDLDSANPHDWQTANQLGLELAKQAFPDYQVAIYTQLDGSGHKLHNHIIVNMPNLKTGEKYHEHQSWQRLTKINDEISREHGLSIINRNTRAPERRTMAERQLKTKNEYVWKDDLRGRIDKIMSDATISSYKDFSARLTKSGIIVHDRGKNFSYEFLDAQKKHRRARGKALGSDYEKETILNELELRQEPSDPDINHLRKYSREAETSYLSSQQRSDRHGRDHQIAKIDDHETERDNKKATNTGQRVDSLRSSINGIAEAIRRYYRRIIERIKLARLKEQQRAQQRKPARRPRRGLGR
ncbi:relaxase/mobilization nuclease domain-containing protein (plasmid) [Lactiplantibacillus plantarum]|uniref:relaxase/mobilization nuclease domain-containing protein n=1 Tax=Lactiplantibacillus plantarum TaxID=1590 RepID=UPI003F78EDAC